MKSLLATLLVLCASGLAAAQSAAPPPPAAPSAPTAAPAGAPDLAVVKSAWSKERVNWERDPFGGAVENFDEMRARAVNEKRVDNAKRGGNQSDIDRVRREARADSANIAAVRGGREKPARYVFVYKVLLRNTGARAVRAVDWDYVFYEKGTANETGRLQFASEARIAPGKSKELTVVARQPPARTVSAHVLNDRERDALDEHAVVVRIEYEDGTVWKRP